MIEAYKQSGHKYHGRNVGRGCRQVSKVARAVNGMASYDLLDEVAREDARRRRLQVVDCQGNKIGNLSQTYS